MGFGGDEDVQNSATTQNDAAGRVPTQHSKGPWLSRLSRLRSEPCQCDTCSAGRSNPYGEVDEYGDNVQPAALRGPRQGDGAVRDEEADVSGKGSPRACIPLYWRCGALCWRLWST